MNFRKKKSEPKQHLPKLDLSGVVAPERMRPLQFVHGAFLASCLGVLGMTFLSRPVTEQPSGLATVQMLSLVGIVLWLGGYIFGMWWFRSRMKAEVLHAVAHAPFRGPKILAEGATIADKVAHHLRNAWTIRLMALALGPIVSLLSVQVAIQGNLVRQDVSFVTTGIFPMIVFMAISALTFPTADRVRSLLHRSMQQ